MTRTEELLKRNRGIRKTKPVIALIFEGHNQTEKNYFSNFYSKKSSYILSIVNVSSTDCVSLVEEMIEYKRVYELTREDFCFCVFDFDADPLKEKSIVKALSLASEHEIKIIFSNPCFELWFLNHFEYTTAFLTNKEVLKRLKKYIPDYTKNKDYFEMLLPKFDVAIRNSKKQKKFHFKNQNYELFSNPVTNVYELIELLRF